MALYLPDESVREDYFSKMNKFENMINEVLIWLTDPDTTEDERDNFIKCNEEKLHIYHDSLGRSIRNIFKLWETDWIPEIRNGVDYSENHPDQISMRIIKEVWRRNQ